jgi:hypothetical protein
VQQAAQELLREPVDDLALPAGELDLALVLAARPVLRERLRPATAVRNHSHEPAAGVRLNADPARQFRALD